ncbi:MAG: hypothetical protein ACNYWM_01395 [Methanosarcinales archaeon]
MINPVLIPFTSLKRKLYLDYLNVISLSGTRPNFYDRDEKEDNPIYFTVANICVSDEHSSGSVTHTTTDLSSTGEPSSEGLPGFGVITAVLSIVSMVLWMRRK